MTEWTMTRITDKPTPCYLPGSDWLMFRFTREKTKIILAFNVKTLKFSQNKNYQALAAVNPELLNEFLQLIQQDIGKKS